MFILYAIPVGLALGFLLGGRFAGLGAIRFRWAWLAILGFGVQVVLFSEPVAAGIGDAGPPLYVGSTALVLLAVLRNLAIPGMVLVALGAAANLAAIVANGGSMPASPEAALEHGRAAQPVYSNSVIVDHPALEPLTDVIALPQWLPFSNIVSIGDVIIAVGVVVVIAASMRSGRSGSPEEGPQAAPVHPGNSPI